MIRACLNGARTRDEHAFVPITPDELAAEVGAAARGGAAELHVHPRGPDGAETLRPADVAAALDAIRAAAPGLPVGVGTGAWIAPGPGQLDHVAVWSVRPDWASVNMSEADAPEAMALL